MRDTAENRPPRGPGSYRPERQRNPLVRSQRGGRVLSAMMLPLLAASPTASFGVITTTGRRTSKRRRKCVRLIRRGSSVYLVSIGGEGAAWVKNLRADPNVELRMRGGSFRGRARDLRDQDEADQARQRFCETIYPFDYVECTMHCSGRPTRAKIERLHHKWFDLGTPLVVDLEEGA
jgi:deazaflavin-dependent oxidoreductase (nitroreductase family)